jgi:hypothetical protein
VGPEEPPATGRLNFSLLEPNAVLVPHDCGFGLAVEALAEEDIAGCDAIGDAATLDGRMEVTEDLLRRMRPKLIPRKPPEFGSSHEDTKDVGECEGGVFPTIAKPSSSLPSSSSSSAE